MYPASIENTKETISIIKLKILASSKYFFVKSNIRGSQRNVLPIFPYSIQTLMYEESPNATPATVEDRSFNLSPLFKKRYMKNAPNRG